jgi:HPt (histidine-containing phosphotransfer) domain-containing protein
MLERARRGDQSAYVEAERLAHSLHGAAAMFGFPELSTSGGAIEHLIESARVRSEAAGAIDDSGVLLQLLDCTEHLAHEVESAARITPVS